MRRMYGIGENSLTWMKCVRPLLWQRLVRFAARSWFRFLAAHFEQRQIFNRSGPGKDRVVEFRKVLPARNIGLRQNEKYDVPQRGGGDGTARKSLLPPRVFEETRGEKFSRLHGTFEGAGQTAGKALAKRAPAYFELWFDRARQMHRRRGGIGLSQEVERIVGLDHRHESSIISLQPDSPNAAS